MSHAAGVLLTHGNRALFLKRSDKARDHAGEWCCPGGSLEAGETAEQAARRELQEETGITGLIQGDFNRIDEGNGFATFRQTVDDEPIPTLNDEHTDAVWAPLDNPPLPLHPGVAATLKKLLSSSAQDKREWDSNGWFEVLDNPLSVIGVYPYRESTVKVGGDHNKMVNVFRAPEELSDPETVKSFRLMPWTDDHPDALLGDESQGLVPAEKKGVHGVIGEQTYYRDGKLYGNIKVFSEQQARKISEGKRELSCGYRCDFAPSEGVYDGTPYQYVQKNLRGNHVASVKVGRMGSGVRVLDAADYFTFALDLKESEMPCKDCGKAHTGDCSMDAESEKLIADSFNSLVGELKKKGYSKEYATKVAGKVAAEKGKDGHDSIGDSNEVTTMPKANDGEAKSPEAPGENPSKKGDLKSPKGEDSKDSMTEEEEGASDGDDDKKDDKEAKDGDEDKDDDKKEAKDKKGKDAKDSMKGMKGMDAADVEALVKREIAKAAPNTAELVRTIRKEENAKAQLYGRISPITGAFDHAEMSHAEMAAYGLKKLGAADAADPITALDYYLAGRTQVMQPTQRTHAQDSSDGSFVDRYLNS